ncbi:MAG: histidine phosphatase family protein [Oscillospiraceae bacterium]|nr:histidine phosphatase family protein [Oscillospiraceae bacterium]
MRIVFVRHGHPDYANDCLTELGKHQALACAEKMAGENIKAIYSSTCGRAYETAEATAKRIGLSIIPLDFMREIRWGEIDKTSELIDDGHPWNTAEQLSQNEDFNLLHDDWKSHKYFSGNIVLKSVETVCDGFAEWMTQFGYKFLENGKLYCEKECNDIVAIFSHGGSGAAALAKLFNLPFPYVCLTYAMNFTSITVVNIPSKAGSIVMPRLLRLNDDRHVTTEKITFQM